MKTQESADFAELLAEAGVDAGEVGKKEKSLTPAAPLRTEDALSLSVQGKKAIAPQTGMKKGDFPPVERESLNTDWQGNRVRLSASARGMARDMEENVAWETRLERKKKAE